MGLLDWVERRAFNGIMDACDKFLVVTQVLSAGSGARQLTSYFVEEVGLHITLNLPISASSDDLPAAITVRIERLHPDHRSRLATELMDDAVRISQYNLEAAAAKKYLALWLKLVEIRAMSPSSAFRAGGLIKLFEIELLRIINDAN